jgi:ribosome biogenesis GTPase
MVYTMSDRREGLIIKSQSGFFTVRTDKGDVICQLAGRLKKERQQTDLAAIGDHVKISVQPDGPGVIDEVAERQRVLSRARPSGRESRDTLSDREQVIVANPDQVILVFSVRQPAPSLRKLDRMLVLTEREAIPTVICVTKLDLADSGEAEALFKPYSDIGYPVIYTSAETGQGLDELRETLAGKLSVLAGSSGVGKSSLLNALQPGLGLKVRQVSQATDKGLHTTRFSELIPFEGGYVADTPGIRGVGLFDIEPSELDGYFREMAPLVEKCQFSDCSHQHEPKCAIREAVKQGKISPERFESYLRLREEQEKLDQAAYGLL